VSKAAEREAVIKRRDFITLLGASAMARPLASRAQQPARRVVGLLNVGSAPAQAPFVAALLQGLKETGHAEGQNLAVEYRYADFQNERLPALAAELVQHRVSAIVAIGGPASVVAAKAATATIPIVFAMGGDPIKLGFVASLNRREAISRA
jgi:putative ABC transport system substrate-binding protein